MLRCAEDDMKLNKTVYVLLVVVTVLLLVLIGLAIACVVLVSQDISEKKDTAKSASSDRGMFSVHRAT